MTLKKAAFYKNPFTILLTACTSVIAYPVILLPFIFTAFIQLFCLEILYFIPQYPDNSFFTPIVRNLWGEAYLHYPTNFYLLPQLFQSIELPIALFAGSFFTAMAVNIFARINDGETIHLKEVAKDTLKKYMHIVLAALAAFFLLSVLLKGHALVVGRALEIRSTSGPFFLLKQIFVESRLYVSFGLSVLSTALLAYLYPLIIIDKKKITSAIKENFLLLGSLFWTTLIIVFLCSLLFVPVLLLKFMIFKGKLAAEWTVILLVSDVLSMMVINTLIYTSLTTVYLLRKETQQ